MEGISEFRTELLSQDAQATLVTTSLTNLFDSLLSIIEILRKWLVGWLAFVPGADVVGAWRIEQLQNDVQQDIPQVDVVR